MDSVQKVATGKKAVTPALALRVARFAGVPVDELLAGPVAVGPGVPALRPPAGRLRRRGDGRRVDQGNDMSRIHVNGRRRPILGPPTVVILTFWTRRNARGPYAARRLNLRKKADVIIVDPVRRKLRRRRTAQTLAHDPRVESTSYFWNSTRGDGKVPRMGREATRNDTWRRKRPQKGGCVQKASKMLVVARSRKPYGRPFFRRCSGQVTGGSK